MLVVLFLFLPQRYIDAHRCYSSWSVVLLIVVLMIVVLMIVVLIIIVLMIVLMPTVLTIPARLIAKYRNPAGIHYLFQATQ